MTKKAETKKDAKTIADLQAENAALKADVEGLKKLLAEAAVHESPWEYIQQWWSDHTHAEG